jgi:hypothetical protein
MKRLLVLFVSVLMCACAKERKLGPQVVDPEFTDYVAQFEVDAAAHGHSDFKVTASIVFGNPASVTGDSMSVGACEYDNNTIYVDKTWWDQYSPAAGYGNGDDPLTANNQKPLELARKMLIYHELGHCALDRHQHVATEVPFEYCSMLGMGWTIPTCPSYALMHAQEAVSIMNPDMPGMAELINNPDTYQVQLIDELFQNAGPLAYGNLF